ncbi:iron-siderophore ABC transporter substrate-binding protein [Corynebacterium sp. TAE3-ERU30]|uniref:iron-siderophore ABC transporter substrate-binding protein n=1 Tax=Corynebacterium sp. TAE3-ERU30 TaxID=2849496 RepID=UPI001C484E3F|nr:iron-siderophore ABC transporter substrate-binding protein [Corynebacterium sp. TAE3-ERU30]MBV7282083.1 iron-siderophore ABC transporter substrate-binding protein [Corynebacterium sp. TAE3-ERU30]
MKKTLMGGLAALLAISTLSACAGETIDAPSSSSESSDAVADASAFPVTIEHKFGESIVNEAPQRVVSVGYTDQDALLAFGITPVLIREWEGMAPEGEIAGEWASDRADGETEMLTGKEINVEKVAEAKPDLIVATYSGIDQEMYDKLSVIAPVIAQKGEYPDYQQPWQVTTQEIGQAVGKGAEAEEMVQKLEKRFSDAARPEWKGKKAIVAIWKGDKLYAFSSQDPRSRFFEELGFVIPSSIDEIAGDSFNASISPENVDVLNEADVIIWDQLSYAPNGKESVTEESLFDNIDAVKNGHSVYLEGELEKAFGWQTVLSLNYALDNIQEPLAEATPK